MTYSSEKIHEIFTLVLEAISKTRASCFIRGYKHLETIKALGLRPRAFICFSVFGTPDETLALVFDILHKMRRFDGAVNWPEMHTYTRKLLHLKFNVQFIQHNIFLP